MGNELSVITLDKVLITDGYGIINLYQLSIESIPNEHAIAIVKGVINAEVGVQKLKSELESSIVKIRQINDNGEEEYIPIFSGYVDEIDIVQEEYDYFLIEMKLLSGSSKLDIKKKSRSFQDISNTYEDILNALIHDTDGGAIRCNFENDCCIEKPLIQYNETDWEFIKRILSYKNCSIIPELEWGLPRIYAGVEKNNNASFCEKDFIKGVSGKFYELGGFEEGYNKGEFIYYKVKSYKNYNIGTEVNIDGKNLIICEKKAEFIRGELIFSYVIGSEILTAKRKYFNENISGSSIVGTVLETEGETVKLHLDIDKSQDQGTAYPYKWVPQTGNMMYCMPKVKSKVALYFGDSDEQKAIAISCVRNNGDSCDELSDNNNQYLTTEHNKRLAMTPSTISFIGDITNSNSSKFEMLDDMSITFKSNSKLTMITSAKIKINSKEIRIIAPIEIRLSQGNSVGLTCNNQFDVKSENKAIIICTDYCEYLVIMDKPVEVEFDWGELLSKVVAAIVIIAAVTIAAVLIVGTAGMAGPIIAGAAIGASVAVGATFVEDYQTGNVSTGERLFRKGVIGAISGAITGALAYWGAMGVTLGSFKIGGVVSGIGGNLVGTTVEWGWTSLSGTEEIGREDFAMGIITGIIGGKLGDYLELIKVPIGGKWIGITKNSRLIQKFTTSSKGQLKAMLRNLGETLGIREGELCEMFGVTGINQLKRLISNTGTGEARVELLKKAIESLGSKVGVAQAFEGIIPSILVNEGTDVLFKLFSGISDNILTSPGIDENSDILEGIFNGENLDKESMKGLEVQYE